VVSDRTYISSIIAALYVVASLHCLWRTIVIGREGDAARRAAERAEAAIKASANGKPQGGRTADLGTGEGGEGQITAREVTPSSITTTGGGDPSNGGPLDPGIAREESRSIVFSPLPPPRMPLKDAPQ
jgi:hypothetical protein